MGWYGREFLYRHLVDEYWELKEEFQHLREYCRAFHHSSKNLKRIEKQATDHGRVLGAGDIGNVMVYPRVMSCPLEFKSGVKCPGRVSQFEDCQRCLKCGTKFPHEGLMYDAIASNKRATWLPAPVMEKMETARGLLPPNAVGVTAGGFSMRYGGRRGR